MKKSLGIGYLLIDALIIITAIFLLYRVAKGSEHENQDFNQSKTNKRIPAYTEIVKQDQGAYDSKLSQESRQKQVLILKTAPSISMI